MTIEQTLSLVRPCIASLKPYSTARDEYQGPIATCLDANENPYDNGRNRYPSTALKDALRSRISAIKGVPAECVFLGNGSDEAIDLCYRIFCNPGHDNAVIMAPSYGMYTVCADINDIEARMVQINGDFSLPVDRLLAAADGNTRLMWVCSPNNPTGNAYSREDLTRLARSFDGVLVVDEAYIDFSTGPGMLPILEELPNLIVLQTLSKAYGMAGLRVGLAFAHPGIIKLFRQVKYPYNIGTDTLELALKVLDEGRMKEQVDVIVAEREKLSVALKGYGCVKEVFPSDANFLLVKTERPRELYDVLLRAGLIVRDRSGVKGCEGCLRITVGTPEENARLLEVVKAFDAGNEVDAESSGRIGIVTRNTRETLIRVLVDLDGKSPSHVATGLHFFDHMLDQIVHHGGVSLQLDAVGDLAVDEHHTMEDVGIALGSAILKALGDKRGIERYGFVLPMDECDATVVLDLGGRIDFRWDVEFTREFVGDTPTEMFKHFFQSLGAAMQANLHISARGENNHHLAEAVFKAFARTLRAAVYRMPFNYELPSSKGVL